jgi:hypothetical protein
MDMTDTIIPKSDQLNAEDLLSGPRTVTIIEVRKGASAEQPVDIILAEFPEGRPFKPSKTVRRILVAAWGIEAAAYVGRRMTIYRDPAVRFGGQDVGGIRISHLSHIDKPLSIALTVTRGKRAPYVIQPLTDEPSASKPPTKKQVTDATVHYRDKWGVTVERLEQRIGRPSGEWSADDIGLLRSISGALERGEKRVEDAFPTDDTGELPDPDAGLCSTCGADTARGEAHDGVAHGEAGE